mmetsp:Transcript_56437/g.177253  ORF Transcript_56437/g.177253 Transcript_56437/m.177253 type:complete len:340 (-) Transcript_56437:68-1087(-)
MTLDEAAAQSLISEVADAFMTGLKALVAKAAADLEAQGQQLKEEGRRLKERVECLEEERSHLERDRESFQRERELFGTAGAETLADMVTLNLGGEAHITVLRSTLTQCEDSMLAAAFSGRWELPKDDAGNVFVNFEPTLFLPLVQHLRMRQIEAPEDPTPPPTFNAHEQEACFRRMLRYYTLEDWVYRCQTPEEIQYTMHIDDHTYAVLPPQDPEETVAFGDMSCQTVAVPRGWEVLQTDVEEFDCIIADLASHGWGALRLCCLNPGGGFSSYLTRLHGGGTAGTRWSGDARLLQPVGAPDSRQYRFSSACSARLVVRVRDPPFGSPLGRGEGRRLAAI